MNSLQTFLSPKSVAVVGVSENPDKLGSIIFQNIVESQYQGALIGINPKLGGQTIRGKNCYADLASYGQAIDLVVIVVPGRFVESVIDDCITNRTKNVIIISAGFGEIGEKELETRIKQKCAENQINLLGPNCLGAILPYANLNASFSDGFPAKGNIAFISQSGAFCTSVLDWAGEKNIGFSHFFSLGNKAGLSELELIESLKSDPNVKIFALYLESIRDGQKLLNTIREISAEKPVIILEPGESAAAKKASSSHTGALAPNAAIVREAYREAGAIQVFSMREMFSLLELLNNETIPRRALRLSKRNFGKRTVVITNAGGVGVLSSDLVDESPLDLATLSAETITQLKQKLPAEAGLNNPIDIIGDAPADRYQSALEIIVKDKNVDQILVLLTPQRTTEARKTAEIIATMRDQTDKNIVASFVGGTRVKAALDILKSKKVPAFEFPSDAVEIMGLLANWHTNVQKTNQTPFPEGGNFAKRNGGSFSAAISELLKTAKTKNLPSLDEKGIKTILNHYKLDRPQSENFTDKKSAEKFFTEHFGENTPAVLKISSPYAMHKTELKGVFLNINSAEKFSDAWDNLTDSIRIGNIQDASIQVQEQITGAKEIILGINSDPNFGKVMLFGQGGIYTEVFHDTAVRILPTADFGTMIDQTKIGTILKGVRNESPYAVEKLIATMQTFQQIVHDFPEIYSIDINPLFVTHDRVICADVKIYLK